MNRAAGAIALELGKVEHFGYDPLTGNGRIAMDENGEDTLSVQVASDPLTCARLALDNRVDGF